MFAANLLTGIVSVLKETAAEFNLDQLNTTVNGTCPDGNASSYTMFVDIENFATWRLIFLLSETRVQLHQLFLFVPRDALNNTEFTNGKQRQQYMRERKLS